MCRLFISMVHEHTYSCFVYCARFFISIHKCKGQVNTDLGNS
uniref:Uncharacterized protein n=1 Tax=Anguilla anguilla TaxID=7936 RepID=A0A0E9S632_ANGAN